MDFDLALALFWLKKIVALTLLPPLSPLLVIACGLLLVRRHKRTGQLTAWLGLTLALFFSAPTSVGWLARGLETAPPLTAQAAQRGQAIVILGAGKRRHAPEFGGETVNRLALERLRYGAKLARETGLPVLVTGGAPTGDAPEAELMKTTLESDFGVPVRWAERTSRDTRQNAELSAIHLHAAGIQRILLVTHAAHMPRAQAEFEAQGFEAIPAPTAWLSGPDASDQVLSLMPGANSAYVGWFAAHEWLGLLAQRWMR